MRAVWILVLWIGFVSGALAQASDTNRQHCSNANLDPDLRIGACTRLLSSGLLQKQVIAMIFYNRGVAYDSKGQYDRAIQDYDQAIRLNPDDADAFFSRGFAYFKKGQYDRSIQDYDQAIRLNPD